MPQMNTNDLFSILKNEIQLEILETVSTNTLPVPLRYCKRAFYPYKLDKNKHYYTYERDKTQFGEIYNLKI
jgi:hypothetical protein